MYLRIIMFKIQFKISRSPSPRRRHRSPPRYRTPLRSPPPRESRSPPRPLIRTPPLRNTSPPRLVYSTYITNYKHKTWHIQIHICGDLNLPHIPFDHILVYIMFYIIYLPSQNVQKYRPIIYHTISVPVMCPSVVWSCHTQIHVCCT